jgi:glyceraldehyde 3-phosphate dehydrogenase
MIKVGINGFGRIGRLAARIILKDFSDKLDLACINTSGSMDTSGWTHLFKYDTAYGKYQGKVSSDDAAMTVDNKKIPVLGVRDPQKIPWEKYGVEIVIESTGVFRKKEDAKKHLRGTVKKIILSAPPKEGDIPMYVLGVNDSTMGNEEIISCASCTTNCTAPVAKVIDKAFGIKKGLMTTIHAYTSGQNILDGSHKDLRRARAAAVNIVPTTTGAAKATGKVYPALDGIFDGLAIRVPIITGSLTDFTFVTNKKTSVEQVNKAFIKASKKDLKGILGITKEPIVSSDIIGINLSCLVDLSLTRVMEQDLVKIIAWYDNEWGYTKRLIDEVVMLGDRLDD